MARVLITGGSGFIATNLFHELEKRNHEVILAVNVRNPTANFVRCDVGHYRQIDNVLKENEIDFLYHAAAEYGRWNGENHYENLWQTNAVGTKNILRAQKEYGFKMIFFGSAEVYGDYDGVMNEDIMDRLPIRQMNDYAISKWVNELQIMNSEDMDGTESVRVRLFNVYGPHEHFHPYRGVVPVFIYNSLHGYPYTVYRGHKRTFEFVEDIARSFANIIDHFHPGEVYNLGSDIQYDIEELAKIILKYAGDKGSKITYKDAEPFTTRFKVAPSEKAKKDIDHRITVPLDEGIKRTVEWFRYQYRIGD